MKTAERTLTAAYDYESDWKQYVFPDSESEFASTSTIKKIFKRFELDSDEAEVGGIPLACDGKTGYVNDGIEHTIIFGESGSGKSYSLIMPLIPMLAKSQSMFVTDIKGELSSNPKIRGYLEHVGCKCVFLDFRQFDKDSYNLLEYPFTLYRKGKKDKAMATVTAFIRALSQPFASSNADPYWHMCAEEYLLSLIQILFEVCSSRKDYYKYVNMLTIAAFSNDKATSKLEHVLERYIKENNNATEMLRGVLAAPEKTLSCIVSTVSSFLRDFIVQESLLKMLSTSSFEVRSMYREKTCVFLVLPDETNAYNSISALLTDYFYNQLIDEYSEKYQNEKPPCSIAFVMDEFCNQHVNGMESKISASRGRMMRWYLVCQSKQQLDTVYEKAAPTIIGNVKNIIFLQSSDPEMLKFISRMLGTTTITHSGSPEPLMSEEKLKSLPRTPDYRQAIFMRDDIKYKVNLPGFDKYEYLDKYTAKDVTIPSRKLSEPKAYTPAKLITDLAQGEVPVPFSKKSGSPKKKKAEENEDINLDEELEKKLAELFGDMDDDD
ncbi:MAG: type IV secretory system conjugative DNA transfer family protein [Clostridia bacterium]|nr:type IV secretory system conjugative DNA transfer family protein [Clostridia bacterium]